MGGAAILDFRVRVGDVLSLREISTLGGVHKRLIKDNGQFMTVQV